MTASEQPPKVKKNSPRLSYFKRHARLLMATSLIISDFFILAVSGIFINYILRLLNFEPVPARFLLPYVLSFVLVYLLLGLYAPGVSPVDELRRLAVSTTLIYGFFLILLIWFRSIEPVSRITLVAAWILSLFLIPLARSGLKKVLSKYKLWGEPVAVIGYGQLGYKLVNYMNQNPMLGFVPAVVIDRRKAVRPDTRPRVNGLIVRSVEDIVAEGQQIIPGIRTAILVTTETPGEFYESITDIRLLKFSRLIIVSMIEQNSNLWLQPYDLGGIIGLEVGQNLISAWQQALKRIIDLALIVLCLPFIIPIMGVLAILVAVDSKGPLFYGSQRIGKDGKLFQMWKFRTMIPGADQVLEKYLRDNPDFLEEWKANQKLKNDPRITRMGSFLRKYSLDELPQLWNVVTGQMSLVGPRPIVLAEKDENHYGKCYNLYIQVRPGLTGLWQVSGRNDISYGERVRMDEYYVRNWSVWLDVIIIARTPGAVLKGRGAY